MHNYTDLISIDNLLLAWQEFVRGKRAKYDVQAFSLNLIDHIVELHNDLANMSYQHGPYYQFSISDPKPRIIHKASVRDRLLHHAVYRILYPFFDRTFIADSYSCRKNKGTHRALDRFRDFSYQVSLNNTRTGWILKCDIRKFFASIDHPVLLSLLEEYIPNQDTMWLLRQIIRSFSTTPDKGLPLGNLTSQLLCNIYMSHFDQYVKHGLKAKYYIRYADDFVIFSRDKCWLMNQIAWIEVFLLSQLGLEVHQDKIEVRTVESGVDFLGWVHFPDHRTVRRATRRRMIHRIRGHATDETIQSYLGLLQQGNTHAVQQAALMQYWLWQTTGVKST